MPVLTFARYILELSLLEYSFNVETSESLLATAALVLALKIKGIDGWVETLKVIYKHIFHTVILKTTLHWGLFYHAKLLLIL
jgi:hypothetical protein